MKHVLGVATAAILLAAPANAVTVDFEALASVANSGSVATHSSTIATNGMTFSGGGLYKNGFFSADQSVVYGTYSGYPYYLNGYTNPLTIDLGGTYNLVSLDLVNHLGATYTVLANTGLSEVLQIVNGVTATFSLSGPGITSLTVTSADSEFNGTEFIFGIDNITADTLIVPPPSSSVPEPATWTMLISGFGLVGAMMRRKKAAVRFS